MSVFSALHWVHINLCIDKKQTNKYNFIGVEQGDGGCRDHRNDGGVEEG